MVKLGDKVKSDTMHIMQPFTAPFLLLIIFVLLLSLTGCASLGKTRTTGIAQEIGVSEQLNVHLYGSLEEIRNVYLSRGGYRVKAKNLKGFYSKSDNSIHCLKWDFYTCGHELFHVLQYKGNHELLVENGYEHFKETNYTSHGH